MRDNSNNKIYTFVNKDGIKFNVYFDTHDGERYIREYRIDSKKYGSFEEIKTNDAISIIKTITDITISFLNKYKPEEITINHIPSDKERLKYGEEEDSEFWETHKTKRALINKRFLIKKLPWDYFYELYGMTSIITKK